MSPFFNESSFGTIRLLLLMGAVLSAGSSDIRAELPQELKCIQKSFQDGALKGNEESVGFVEDVIKQMASNPQAANLAVQMDNFRVDLAARLMNAAPQTELPYQEYKSKDGELVQVLRIFSVMASRLDDPEFLKSASKEICDAYYRRPDDPQGMFPRLCFESFQKKMEKVKKFLAENQNSIDRAAEEMSRPGAKPTEIAARYRFKMDGELASLGQAGLVPQIDLVDYYAQFGKFSYPVMYEGRQVGFLLPIEVEGQKEFFMVETVPGRTLFDTKVEMPLFYVFGTGGSSEWNSFYERKYQNKLTVQGQRLSDFRGT